MKLETFFEKFDQFADAPDAVARMRELVLNFAVAGRLSEHRAGDVPVSELIDTLSAAQVRRGKTGRRGATAAVAPESVIDRPIDVPSHWAWVPISEIGAMSGGMTPSKDKSTFWDGDVNWFSSKDIKTDELTESELKITRKATQATGLQVYSPGCLVIVARSGILKRTLPVSILRVEGTVNQDLKVLSPFVGGMERYLQIMLRGMTGFILTELVKTGMTVQSLKYEEFEAQPFPLPPLAEQKRIVAKVDELMALCDQLEAQQQERGTRHAALARASLSRFADAPTPANLHFLFHPSYAISPADLRKSILTLAVQGKLVHRIESEGLAADILKQAGVSEEPPEDLPELPTHWIWARLGSIATRMDSGWSPACIPEPAAEGEWGVLKTTAVQTLQYQEVQNKALPPNLEPRPEHEVMDGDILFTRAGPMNRVGILCVARPTRKKLMISDKIIRFHLVVGIDPDFAALSMNAGFSSTVVEGLKSGMAASQVNISQPKLRSVPIPLPPLAEQRRIVAKVEQLMALVDALESQLATSRATAENLLAAVVAELTERTHASPAC